VQKILPEIKDLGGNVIVVSFTPPAKVAAYQDKYHLPFLVLSDPTLAAYKAFALGRTSWAEMLHPATLFRYIKMMLRGWLPHTPGADEDILQLGGDFVLDGRRRLLFAYASKDPTDRPSHRELLQAVRTAIEIPPNTKVFC
jgi:AhpC/TSA antioxidant enzyme